MLQKKSIFVGLFTIFLIAIAGYFAWEYMVNSQKFPHLPTYFSYSEKETASLKNLSSKNQITVDEIKELDDIMFDLVTQDKIGVIGATASKIYAYVYTAQQDAAYLSYNLHHSWIGSLKPVTIKTLCLFFPDQCSIISARTKLDLNEAEYSNQLADVVLNKVKERISEDNKNTHPYPERTGPGYWQGVKPYYGVEIGSWKPWIIEKVETFRAPPPPLPSDPFWMTDLAKMKLAYLNATPEQKKAVVFWAGGPGTVTPPGIWLQYGEEALWQSHFSLQKILAIRATLAMGIADAMISVFDSKYTYWTPRPFMLDHTIVSIMPTPNFPGYPAGHSMISGTAATILMHYFPEQKESFQKLRDEASNSRIWGGIHLILDTEEGVRLGEKLGNAVIQKRMQIE